MRQLHRKATMKLFQLPLYLGIFVFLPAGTLDYWQAWVFCAIFTLLSIVVTLYLAKNDPALLERRMRAGPAAEKEPAQKVIITLAFVVFAAAFVVPALDRRFRWSNVPTAFVWAGDLGVVIAYIAFLVVFRENSFGAATVQIAEGQRVISTGPYALVRHPMYTGALWLLLALPLALGSWWGMSIVIPGLCVLVWRLLDEERYLAKNLPGYAEYMARVRYRLVPYLF